MRIICCGYCVVYIYAYIYTNTSKEMRYNNEVGYIYCVDVNVT